eukprot:jgi/Psemu1/61958/gm1.61958_g
MNAHHCKPVSSSEAKIATKARTWYWLERISFASRPDWFFIERALMNAHHCKPVSSSEAKIVTPARTWYWLERISFASRPDWFLIENVLMNAHHCKPVSCRSLWGRHRVGPVLL